MHYIKITQTQQQSMLDKFTEMLRTGKFSNGKINFNEDLNKVDEKTVTKPIIAFTPAAWVKIKALVEDATGEIGWHGIVEHNANTNLYVIKDIIIYPQTVSAATVTTDATEYATWLMSFDDKTFEKIRYQGHSHVHMGVSPSGVDEHFYDSILRNMQGDDFYIFMIINKRNDIYLTLYDYAQNIIFEKSDIQLRVMTKNGFIEDWVKEQTKQHIKTYTYTPPAGTGQGNIHTPKIADPLMDLEGDEWMHEYYRNKNIAEDSNRNLAKYFDNDGNLKDEYKDDKNKGKNKNKDKYRHNKETGEYVEVNGRVIKVL